LSQGVADPSPIQTGLANGGHQQLHGVVRASGGEIRAALTPGWLTSRSHRTIQPQLFELGKPFEVY
jgi:hypothetical protein